MKQSNLLLNISEQQLQQAGLTRAQARKSLAALDYRDNDVFRHVMNAENPVSRKILTMYLSDLLHRRIVWIGSEATEPVKANFREKGVRYDVMVRIRDDQGKPMLVNLEMQNYRMAESLSLRSQGYASRMVSDQIEVGGSFDFIPVLQIMITRRMPEMKASREYLHYHRYTNEKTSKWMPKERCRTLWIEMEKTQALERIPTEQWRISDKITYMLRYSRDPKKQKIIHELIEKEEVIRMMEEKRMDFLKDTSDAIARMRMKYDEMDEKTVYKKGIEKGMRKGKILLLKDVLNQKLALTETDEACLSNLTEEDINQIVHVLYKINTLEDFHDQLKKLSDLKNRTINNTQFSFSHD
ncbi:hypothetical protein [Holdemania sp. Marseille-P2844]|uniref:hypothetical protein n=3 Tax=Holdemania TaxID=61170 RepID=UPI00093321B5|nr:hypothetical protein [Holdemania sp. Marseille-P2844]